jgi:hypothetical protein
MRLGLARAVVLLLACPLAGCSDAMPSSETGTTSAAGSSSGELEGSSSSSSSSSGASAGDGSSSTTLVWPPDDGISECIRTCEGPFDCCPAQSAGSCPGPYPWNLECIDGLCVPGQCTTDADCPATAGPAQVCRPVDGLRICVTPCADDPNACVQSDTALACSAMTDEGEAYCFRSCDQPDVFCGSQSCDPQSGRCVCRDGGQCINGWVCV